MIGLKMHADELSLNSVRGRQFVCIHGVSGGNGVRSRLYAMGLVPGSRVEVISSGSGPVILEVMGSRLAIGRGMAEKVMVREV